MRKQDVLMIMIIFYFQLLQFIDLCGPLACVVQILGL